MLLFTFYVVLKIGMDKGKLYPMGLHWVLGLVLKKLKSSLMAICAGLKKPTEYPQAHSNIQEQH